MKPSVKAASFVEAFQKFLSYSDGNFNHSKLEAFSKLKDTKKIEYENEAEYWHGNHSHSNSRAELILIEEPCLFYVVKYYYYEMSENSHSKTETFVFVPN